MVLSACSSYFEHLFMAYSENNQIVILKAGSSQTIQAIQTNHSTQTVKNNVIKPNHQNKTISSKPSKF
jgi:hypothetical protein